MQFLGIMLKRAFWSIFLCLVLISFPQPSFALMVRDVPNPQEQYIRGWVTDMANLLDFDTKFKLNQMLSKLEHQNGTEIAVVTVPNTKPTPSPKQFATELFNSWGIGKKGINNGVLFLISKSDHRVEIETGKMIEAILPNDKVGEIINKEIIPRFKQDDFAGGILAGTQTLVMALEGQHEVLMALETDNEAKLQAQIGVLLIIVLFMAVIIWMISGVVAAMNDDEDNQRRRRQSSSEGVENNDAFCGGDSSSSDGGGFGGGDSGGGGDGGGW